MQPLLVFNSRDELFRIPVSKLVYFEADGNYTHIVSKNKLRSTVWCSLTQMEKHLEKQMGIRASLFMRIGRRYIVNRRYIYGISISRQQLTLSDGETFTHVLPVSKESLRALKNLLTEVRI